MMQEFLDRLNQNMTARRNQTLGVLAGLFAAIVMAWIIVNAVLSIGFFGLIIAAPLVLWGATKLPQLSWFWGPIAGPGVSGTNPEPSVYERAEASSSSDTVLQEQTGDEPADTSDADLERIPIPDPSTLIHGAPSQSIQVGQECERVRQTPVGTEVISQTQDRAVLRVKSAIQYWCVAAPVIWSILAFVVFMPVGSFIGTSIAPWQAALSYGTVGGLIGLGSGLLIAVISYFVTRPWVEVTITSDRLRYGDYTFDRQFVGGVRVGYQGDDVELFASFTQGRWGTTVIRLSYGRWGEDLKYMVSSRYVAEIAIWMNEIIDSVGAPPPPRYDPYAGRKIELL